MKTNRMNVSESDSKWKNTIQAQVRMAKNALLQWSDC